MVEPMRLLEALTTVLSATREEWEQAMPLTHVFEVYSRGDARAALIVPHPRLDVDTVKAALAHWAATDRLLPYSPEVPRG